MSFNEDQVESMLTPEQRKETEDQLDELTKRLIARAETAGVITEDEERKLMRQLLDVRTWYSPDVPDLTHRALVELRSLRALVKKIRTLTEGRRHYDGTDGYTCFDALGEVRSMIDEAS